MSLIKKVLIFALLFCFIANNVSYGFGDNMQSNYSSSETMKSNSLDEYLMKNKRVDGILIVIFSCLMLPVAQGIFKDTPYIAPFGVMLEFCALLGFITGISKIINGNSVR